MRLPYDIILQGKKTMDMVISTFQRDVEDKLYNSLGVLLAKHGNNTYSFNHKLRHFMTLGKASKNFLHMYYGATLAYDECLLRRDTASDCTLADALYR